MKLSNFLLRTKLSFCFFLTFIVSMLVGGTGLLGMQRLGHETDELAQNWLPSISAVAEMRNQTSSLRRLEIQTLLDLPAEEIKELLSRQKIFRESLQKKIEEYKKLISSPEERELARRYTDQLSLYLLDMDKAEALIRTATKESRVAASEQLMGPSRNTFRKAAATLDELVALNQKGAGQSASVASQAYDQGIFNMIAILLMSALMTTALTVWIVRMVTRPLQMAVDASNAVAGGNLTTEIRIEGRDEIAQLLQAIGKMQKQLALVVGNVRRNADSIAAASAEIAQGNNDLSSRTESQ